MTQEKAALRAQMEKQRQHWYAEDQAQDGAATRKIAAHILALPEMAAPVQRGIRAPGLDSRLVAGFYPIGTEVDGLFILKALNAIQYRCALPRVVAKDQPLVFQEWDMRTALISGALGTCHVGKDVPAVMPDIILVPLLAFDDRGHRLGYGGGYYDRTLDLYRQQGHAVTSIGVAFSGQRHSGLPISNHDQPLDIIVTEQKVHRP